MNDGLTSPEQVVARTIRGYNAVRAADPDYTGVDLTTSAVDAIANILHWHHSVNPIVPGATVVDLALLHFVAELGS